MTLVEQVEELKSLLSRAQDLIIQNELDNELVIDIADALTTPAGSEHMLTKEELVDVYSAKLTKTGSLDAALGKACWVAYQQGVEHGKQTGK